MKKIRVQRVGFTAHRRKSRWSVRKRGRVTTAVAKVGSWSVRGASFLIKDRGKPGRGPQIVRGVKRGLLTRFGYGIDKSASSRHRALRASAKAYGALSVFRKLNLQYAYRKRLKGKARETFRRDRDWVKRTLMKREDTKRPVGRAEIKEVEKGKARRFAGRYGTGILSSMSAHGLALLSVAFI